MLQDLESSATIGVQDSHDEDGDAQKCASLICATSSTFSLVTSPSQSFPLSTRHDTLVYEACKPTLREVVANLPQISFRYRDLADNVGVRTADMLIPVWQRVYRRIYVTTDPRSTAASSWVDKNKWQEARNLWVDIYMNDKSAPERVRAALNVALSYEREDDSQQAALWCSKALDLIEAASPDVMKSLASEQRHANAMFNYLVERMNQQATLDKQM
jgi:hypothetical protein